MYHVAGCFDRIPDQTIQCRCSSCLGGRKDIAADARFSLPRPREYDNALHPRDWAISGHWQQVMYARVPDLAAFLADSIRELPGYRSGVVPPVELLQWVNRSVFRLIDSFAVPEADIASTLDVAAEVGARRARQGIPPGALHRAYHLGGELLSASLAEWAAKEGIAAQESMTLANKLWRVVGEHSMAGVGALVSAYEECTDQRTAGYRLDALLNGDNRHETVASVARALMLPEDQRYSVIVRHPTPGNPSLRAENLAPFVGPLRFIWRQHGDSAVGVILLGKESPNCLRDSLPSQEISRTGVSTAVAGLASLGRARGLAETAACTLRGPGLAFLEDRLDLAIVASSPELARELQFNVLAPLLHIDERCREMLLQTLEVWLEADGSPARAARQLYCHRNTVLNRLRRIEQMTNRSLSVPRDLVSLSLALRAYRQLVD